MRNLRGDNFPHLPAKARHLRNGTFFKIEDTM